MIKLTNPILIGLISASLLVGCGGGSDNDNEANEATEQVETNEGTEGATTDTMTPTQTSVSFTFGSNVMPILTMKCQNCHGSNGNFKVTDASGTYANILALPGGAGYMLSKGNGMGHGGGDQLSDAEYSTIKAWIDAGAELN